jgi:hypothetical protein
MVAMARPTIAIRTPLSILEASPDGPAGPS